MDVILSIFEERGEAVIGNELIALPTIGNAPFPRASDGHLLERLFETKEDALKYVNRVFPHLNIIDKTDQKSQSQEYL